MEHWWNHHFYEAHLFLPFLFCFFRFGDLFPVVFIIRCDTIPIVNCMYALTRLGILLTTVYSYGMARTFVGIDVRYHKSLGTNCEHQILMQKKRSPIIHNLTILRTNRALSLHSTVWYRNPFENSSKRQLKNYKTSKYCQKKLYNYHVFCNNE